MQKNFQYLALFLTILLLSSCSIFKRKVDDEAGVTGLSKQKINKVIASARDKTGSPYKYGATGDGGYDCSGLVFTSFEEAGIKLPRTSTEQATVGKEIAFEKVRPGDLVFFATKKGDGKITHSGIVTEVREKEVVMFIHAANSGVREDNLYSKYYFDSFVKARRMN